MFTLAHASENENTKWKILDYAQNDTARQTWPLFSITSIRYKFTLLSGDTKDTSNITLIHVYCNTEILEKTFFYRAPLH